MHIAFVSFEFLNHWLTVNADHFYATLHYMRDVIWMKYCSLFTERVVFHNNKILPTSIQLVSKCKPRCSFTGSFVLSQDTSWTLHLATSSSLDCFEGICFRSDEKMKAKVHQWVQTLGPHFFSARIKLQGQVAHCLW
jgi:hypothetical protein